MLMYRLPAKRRSLLFRPGTDVKRHRLTGGTVNPLIDGVPAVAVVTGAIRTFKGAHRLPANAASRRNEMAKGNGIDGKEHGGHYVTIRNNWKHSNSTDGKSSEHIRMPQRQQQV